MRADYPHTAYQVDFRSRHAPPPDTDPPPIADPDGSVHALSQMTPQEVETLTAARQVDHARLLPDATPARVGPAPSRPALAPPQRPRPQCRAEFREARVDTALLNLRQRLRIDPGRATIPLHPPPRLPEDVIPPDPVHQGLEAPRRGPLGRGPEASLQLAHFVERPRLSGELGPVSPAMPSRVLAPTPCPPQGPFPPAACCCAALTGTIAPSDSRCAAAAFTFGLCGPRCPGPRRRASRVPSSSVSACCAPYPAETSTRISRARTSAGTSTPPSGRKPFAPPKRSRPPPGASPAPRRCSYRSAPSRRYGAPTPNYFADTTVFVAELKKAIRKNARAARPSRRTPA